jgi:hypothetical protein
MVVRVFFENTCRFSRFWTAWGKLECTVSLLFASWQGLTNFVSIPFRRRNNNLHSKRYRKASAELCISATWGAVPQANGRAYFYRGSLKGSQNRYSENLGLPESRPVRDPLRDQPYTRFSGQPVMLDVLVRSHVRAAMAESWMPSQICLQLEGCGSSETISPELWELCCWLGIRMNDLRSTIPQFFVFPGSTLHGES